MVIATGNFYRNRFEFLLVSIRKILQMFGKIIHTEKPNTTNA